MLSPLCVCCVQWFWEHMALVLIGLSGHQEKQWGQHQQQ